ncbi:MAG TPA: CHRD domain-containing protein [Thermoanaerobaculia bacterium]|nr:CHRD domain-containing protein [Thermoanaerobaculia bacterium]
MRTLRICLLTSTLLAAAWSAAKANPIQGLFARLHGTDEVPAVLSPGGGAFRGSLPFVTGVYQYQLHYFRLRGNVTEIDVQLAQPGANGGVMVVLCSNLPTAPAGTQPCPATGPATISGQITASAILGGAAAQGVAAGDLDAFGAAVNAGLAYVNLRTDLAPDGEVRGQISTFVISNA